MIGGYVGQTAMKTQKVIQQALGGVLFIDEAYSLLSDDNYSRECISTLIKEIEDNRDNLCVILAGYSQEMEELLKSNSGFESRIAFKIDFSDYTEAELYQIFTNMLKQEGFKLSRNCKQIVLDYFNNEINNNKYNFSNGRLVRNLTEKIKMEQANRIIKEKSNNLDLIIADDITAVVEKIKTKPCKTTIGFIV